MNKLTESQKLILLEETARAKLIIEAKVFTEKQNDVFIEKLLEMELKLENRQELYEGILDTLKTMARDLEMLARTLWQQSITSLEE